MKTQSHLNRTSFFKLNANLPLIATPLRLSRYIQIDIRKSAKSPLYFSSSQTTSSYHFIFKITIKKTTKEPSEHPISIHHSSHSSFWPGLQHPGTPYSNLCRQPIGVSCRAAFFFMNPVSGESGR